MKKNFETKGKHPIRVGYYLLGTVALWSILIGLSLAWNLRTEKSGILEAARIEARTAFEKDVVYRRWNANHGGVYAPVTGITQPNPYLDVPERDITTPLGKKLTQINPAFMTRQVHELALKTHGVWGHITSLNPIRPANAADPWETRALKAFQTGLKEVSSVEEIEGNEYMRFIRPLLTEKDCLKCHAAQGYKLGDIRGGISVSIPMGPHIAIGQSHILGLYFGHGLLWLAGLVGIGFAFGRLNQQIHKRIGVEEALLESEIKHRTLFETMAQGVVYQDNHGNIISANPSAGRILGLSLDQMKGRHSIDPRWKCIHENGSDFPGETHPSMIALKTGKAVKDTIMGVFNSKEENCRWIMINAVPQFREGEDEPYQVYTTFDDITVLKNNEAALKESEARYKSLVELSPEAVFVHQEGIIVYINPAGTRIFGATDYQEFIGKPAFDFIHPDCHEIVKKRIRQAREEKTTLSPTELKYIRLDNKVIDVVATATYIDYLGKPSILSVIKDITDQKLAQAKLHETEERFSLFMDHVPCFAFIKDINGRLVYANKVIEKRLGHKKMEDWYGKTNDQLWPSEAAALFSEADQRVFAEGRSIEFVEKIPHPDGQIHTQITNKFPIYEEGELAYLGGIGLDITNLKQTEDALRESEEKFRVIFEQAAVGVAQIESETGRFLSVNQKYCDIIGYTRDEMMRSSLEEITHPDDLQISLDAVKRLIMGTVRDTAFEKRYIHKDGSTIWINLTISPMWGVDEKSNYHIAVVEDITDRKQVEEALRKSEEKFSRLFLSSPILVALSKLEDGTYLEVNDAFEKSTGFDRKDVIGRTSVECGLWADPRERERIKKVAQEKGVFRGQEVNFLTKKGDPLPLLWSADVIELDGEACLLATAVDISEIRKAEQEKMKLQDQLQRAQKMEAMGLMAGGVAHDLNNILSGIVSLPELLLMNLAEDSPLRKPIKTIQESGMRAAAVVDDLLTIARGVASSKETLNLNTLVEEYLKSAEYEKLESTRSFVNFKTELDPDLLNMSGSPIHIKKILMNLVTNASEAIEGSGTVTISTVNQYLDKALKGYEDVRTGEYVMLTVSDDGTGISPGDLERIFEPFYTKKVMGKSGTGLGLAVVWNTVQDHDGYINVKSSGKGTVFELYFSVTRGEVAAEGEEVPLEDYLGDGEKILVVDDEEGQREIASGMLTELGYNVETVSSGEDAIEYVKEHPVDLIVLDMVMPKGINGRETYEEIIKIRPGQKVVIASGYAKSKEVDIAQGLGAGKYIKKPYILGKIGVAVKEELEK